MEKKTCNLYVLHTKVSHRHAGGCNRCGSPASQTPGSATARKTFNPPPRDSNRSFCSESVPMSGLECSPQPPPITNEGVERCANLRRKVQISGIARSLRQRQLRLLPVLIDAQDQNPLGFSIRHRSSRHRSRCADPLVCNIIPTDLL